MAVSCDRCCWSDLTEATLCLPAGPDHDPQQKNNIFTSFSLYKSLILHSLRCWMAARLEEDMGVPAERGRGCCVPMFIWRCCGARSRALLLFSPPVRTNSNNSCMLMWVAALICSQSHDCLSSSSTRFLQNTNERVASGYLTFYHH